MKNKVYPFNKRGIEGKEKFIQDGIECVHHCFLIYEGEAVDDCIRNILIDFEASGWSTGFKKGQEV